MVARYRFIMIAVLCLLVGAVGVHFTEAQDQCFDAAGGVIPCPPTPEPPRDSDGDGIPNNEDRCPARPGPADLRGCPPEPPAEPTSAPASDEPTSAPASPEQPPTVPDSDGDGFVDTDDRCPAEAGVPGLGRGDCPDSDGDSITNDADLCPAEPGTAELNGCAAPATDVPTEAEPSTEESPTIGFGALPGPEDACQIGTLNTTQRINIRAAASLEAAVVGTLTPGVLYPVLAVTRTSNGDWYRIADGWVNTGVILQYGDCPEIFQPANVGEFIIDANPYDEESSAGGIYPDTECFQIFNGMIFCQTELKAVDEEGATEQSGVGPAHVCGIGPGGIICTPIDILVPGGMDCIPEFCEPSPVPPGLPGPEPDNPDPANPPGLPDDNEPDEPNIPTFPPIVGPFFPNIKPTCEDVLGQLASGDGAEPYILADPQGNVVEFGFQAPPVDPEPCQVNILLVGDPYEGFARVRPIAVEIDLPAPTDTDSAMIVPTLRVETTGAVILLDAIQIDPDGGHCIPTTPGDFAACSLAPVEIAAESTPPPFNPLAVDELLAGEPDMDDPTEYSCGIISFIKYTACECSGARDCGLMGMRANCVSEMYCTGDDCVCMHVNPNYDPSTAP